MLLNTLKNQIYFLNVIFDAITDSDRKLIDFVINIKATEVQIIIDYLERMLRGNQSINGEQEIIVNFSIEKYPFPSIKQSLPTYFRAVQIFSFTTSDLERLTSIHHRNLVNLKRIVKTNFSSEYMTNQDSNLLNLSCVTLSKCTPCGYYLYYQPVQRGLHNRKKLAEGLNRVAKFLIQNNIFYEFRECDIGYDQFNQIKVFVPPLIILGKIDRKNKSYRQLTEEDVYESINKLISSNLSDIRDKIDRINDIDQQLKQIKKQLQIRERQKIKKQERIRYHEQRKNRQRQVKQSRNKDINNERNQQRLFNNQFLEENIEQEILNFARNQFSQQPQMNNQEPKMKMGHLNNQRAPDERRQSMPHEVMRHSGSNQMRFNFPIQMVNWGQGTHQQRNKIPLDIQQQGLQKFQQNINCINIYHNTKPEQIVQIKPKPSYIIHHYPTTKRISGVYDDISDSLDTYELQIGETREMPKMEPRSKLRHTVLPTSQRNYSSETNQNSTSRRDKKKWIYGSAGHKQFAQYVKSTAYKEPENREKPPRKSNICEQSIEESMTDIRVDNSKPENKVSISLVTDRQTEQTIARDYQTGLFIKNEQSKANPMYNSHIQQQISPIKWEKNYRQSFQNKQKSPLTRKKSEDILETTLKKKGGQIHHKVNQALLKTKAAIQILKKVRTNNTVKNDLH